MNEFDKEIHRRSMIALIPKVIVGLAIVAYVIWCLIVSPVYLLVPVLVIAVILACLAVVLFFTYIANSNRRLAELKRQQRKAERVKFYQEQKEAQD